MNGCITLRILFANGDERTYPVHPGGDWRYGVKPDRLVVRPYGADGNARHEIPLSGVHSVMVVKPLSDDQEDDR